MPPCRSTTCGSCRPVSTSAPPTWTRRGTAPPVSGKKGAYSASSPSTPRGGTAASPGSSRWAPDPEGGDRGEGDGRVPALLPRDLPPRRPHAADRVGGGEVRRASPRERGRGIHIPGADRTPADPSLPT